MKRFMLVLLVVAFMPITTANAQLVSVGEAAIVAAIEGTALEQAVYWAQQAMDMVDQIARMKEMIENLGRQIEMQVENLSNIGNIHSFKDFTEWHNRQLYLERMTEDAWNNMSIKIGKKDYKLTDVQGMASGFKDTYIDYWNKEFTEAQREEMYVGLGLTPANYAYIKTWEAREEQLLMEYLAAATGNNIEYVQEMIRNNDYMNELERDKKKKDGDPTKMGEKGVAVINAQTNIANNKVLNDINHNLTKQMEKHAVDEYKKKASTKGPPMSKWDKEKGIQPLMR